LISMFLSIRFFNIFFEKNIGQLHNTGHLISIDSKSYKFKFNAPKKLLKD
jgi:hypothetical protein